MRGIAALLTVVLAGCVRTPPDSAPASEVEAPRNEPTTAAAPEAPAPPNPNDLTASISDRFAKEAASRPNDTVRVEDVYEAFGKAGVTMDERRQHLGAPLNAKYCVGAKHFADNLHFSVCEYADAEAAKNGRAVSLKAFGSTNRDVWVNGQSTLTILQANKTAASDAKAKKLSAVFSKLAPPRR